MNFIKKIKFFWFCRKELFVKFKVFVDLVSFQKMWRLRNSHNGTTVKNKFNIDCVTVGNGTYGEINYIGFGNPDEKLIIGNYCSIAGNVTFLGGGEHPINLITTFPYAHHILGEDQGVTPTKGKIVIEDDVWICHGAIILSGVTIGKGSVIGAGAIVTKNVEPYSIIVGSNKLLRKRFDEEIVKELCELDLQEIKGMSNEKQEYLLRTPVTKENVKMLKDCFTGY